MIGWNSEGVYVKTCVTVRVSNPAVVAGLLLVVALLVMVDFAEMLSWIG